MCFESNDIEFVWSSLKFTILYGMKLFIPKVRLRSHQRPKWVTSNLQHDLNRFRTLKRKCKLHPTLQNLSRLNSTESMLQEKLKQAKSTYETTLVVFASSQNHKIYKYINSLSSKNYLPATMFLDSSSANSDLEKASLFNKYFHSIFTRSSFVLPPIDQLPPVAPLLRDISLTASDVHSELTKLYPSKSMGIDNIGPKILKLQMVFIYLFTTYYVSLFLISLFEWGLHSVTPIF